MSMIKYKVREHSIPCQHLREYPYATADAQEKPLQLVINQYTPLNNLDPSPGDVTIIATHANAMPKEAYEPLWEELILASETLGYRIRNIWMADMAHQGASATLNEENLGNDPHWFDHSRDLLLMVNHFREDMPRPIVGIGHSLGAAQLVFLSLLHPSLLTSLVLIEPWITAKTPASGVVIAKASTFRKDVWPSIDEAENAIRASPLYKAWDERALSRMLTCGLRSTPTVLYPEDDPNAVTLTTTKHQEAFTVYRPNWQHFGVGSLPSLEERVTHPDIAADSPVKSPFYNTWRSQAFRALRSTRCPVLYIYGSKSMVATPEFRAEKLRVTGAGFGGSGGAKLGQVKQVIVRGSHFVPMENVQSTAVEAAKWLGEQMATFKTTQQKLEEARSQVSMRERQMMSEQWLSIINDWDGKPASKASKL